MSRIYTVTSRKDASVVRYVRASTLNSAIRAVAAELYAAEATTTDDLYQAMQLGQVDILNAVTVDADDPGPVPAGGRG